MVPVPTRLSSFSCRLAIVCLMLTWPSAKAASVFVEAESFADHGGWTLDTQFIEIMGSPYLLAHGLGRPVRVAETTVSFPQWGRYQVYARTKDWVARWSAPGSPGRFEIAIDGQTLPHAFGAEGAEWHWESGGTIDIEKPGDHQLALRDLTGFDGRVDALFFTTDPNARPPQTRRERKELLGLPEHPPETKEYDLVVCGGGYAGMAAALSAARQGLQVALIQNRPVLGGNGSSEIRVWAQGGTRRGRYPRLGEIVEEFADQASNSPGRAEEFGDAKKEAVVRAEDRIDLFLNSHALGVEMEPGSDSLIRSVLVLDTRTGAERKFRGKLFADCTGHGSIGAAAGAAFALLEKGHLGMSNMWKWEPVPDPAPWPLTPWALPLTLEDFPPTKQNEGTGDVYYKGEWFWESGFDKHPLADLELTRDWNLRAVFGAFSAMKQGPEAERYAAAQLIWVAAIGGTRESRLLRGDIVLAAEDIVGERDFPDGCVPTTWDLDLHYPKQQYAGKFPENPFISRAEFGQGVDRRQGYPIPYRCFYSTNIANLFMAGRCISVTHEALGTTRVMRTCGMMGEVVGKAAYLCVRHDSEPRGIYERYLSELIALMQQPGAARRAAWDAPLVVPENAASLPPPEAVPLERLPGLVVDESQAVVTGPWSDQGGLPGYVGRQYLYAGADSGATARYEFAVPRSGLYEVRVSWGAHPNRARRAAYTIETALGPKVVRIDQRQNPPLAHGFGSLGVFEFHAGTTARVTLTTRDAGGTVHADAVQILESR